MGGWVGGWVEEGGGVLAVCCLLAPLHSAEQLPPVVLAFTAGSSLPANQTRIMPSPPALHYALRPALPLRLLQMASIPDVDLSKVGTTKFGSFEVEVVDYTTEYFDTLKVGGEMGSWPRQPGSSLGGSRAQRGVQCSAVRHAPRSDKQLRGTSGRPSPVHLLTWSPCLPCHSLLLLLPLPAGGV